MDTASDDSSLPLLAIVYGSLSLEQPLQRLAEAASGICRLLWVLPVDSKDSRSAIRFSRAEGTISGDVIDASRLSEEEAADAIRSYRPDGITCFIDETIMWTADVAALLDLPFHSRHTATRLTDKLEQRRALQAHGLRTPVFRDLDELEDEQVLAEVIESVGLPLVLKPRRGTSSKDVEPIRTADALRAAVSARTTGRMLVEGFIPDPADLCARPGSAPYGSVEVLVSDAHASVLAVTGRSPLAEPFRETGQYFPANMSEEDRAAFSRVAVEAAQALGIVGGVLHVEVKRTDDGPVVIEVNGRPGGGNTWEFLRRARRVDLIKLEMRVALGEQIRIGDLPDPTEVLFLLDVQPDARLRRVTAVNGLDDVRLIPGVEQVVQSENVGDDFSWRQGTLAQVATVSGSAPDHDAVQRIRDKVLSTIEIIGTE